VDLLNVKLAVRTVYHRF